MMRFVMPIILIGISITVFVIFADPMYSDVGLARTQIASYDEALNNSKALENERDKLTAKENSIDPANIAKLEKLLPENVDNIRLILEIEDIASPYGMILKDIKYSPDVAAPVAGTTPTAPKGGATGAKSTNKDYGVWNLEFSTAASYNNFLNFTKDLESNLRIVDVSSIQFASNANGGPASASNPASDVYKYSFKIKTYWLKN